MNRAACLALVAMVTLGVAIFGTSEEAVAVGPAPAVDAGAAVTTRGSRVTPPTLDTLERACTLLTSCERLPLGALALGNVHDCVDSLADQLDGPTALLASLTLRECALTARSCDELRTCALRGVKVDACKGRGMISPVAFCDDVGRAVTCLNGDVSLVRDCPRGGEACSASGGAASCTFGSCGADAGANAASGPYCATSGTRRLECVDGKLASVDCSAFGLVCASSPSSSGGTGCAPAGATSSSCTGDLVAAMDPGAIRCDGDVAVGCLRGREVSVDCAAAGLVCGGDGDPVGLCRLSGGKHASCPGGTAPRCEGKSLVYCAEGATRKIACDALGFTRCASRPGKGATCQ